MGTDTFGRHTRACVDAAVHRVFASNRHDPSRRAFFERLVRVARSRSNLLSIAPAATGEIPPVNALHNLLAFERALVRDPDTWPGATGHPLRVIDSLVSHLFGRYPAPRFLASVWFGSDAPDRIERRRWFVAHALGQRFRSLPLPFAMTRHMEHLFLRTPDHLVIDHALRRAEILGLGGTPELAAVVLTTRLADHFDEPERWRRALLWLANCGDSVDLTQVRPFIAYLHANLDAVDLRGRTFASVMRLVRAWHGWLGHQRMRLVTWPGSRWHEMVAPVEPTPREPRRGEWSIVELLDSRALAHEGRAMRHCVSTYVQACTHRSTAIWSVRHRWCDEGLTRSVLTIEVRPDSGVIVQVRGKANARATGWPLQLVRRWAMREGLRFHRTIAVPRLPTGSAERRAA